MRTFKRILTFATAVLCLTFNDIGYKIAGILLSCWLIVSVAADHFRTFEMIKTIFGIILGLMIFVLGAIGVIYDFDWVFVFIVFLGGVITLQYIDTYRHKNPNSALEATVANTGQPVELSEHQLRKMGLTLFEYKLIPAYIERLKQFPGETVRFIDVSIWKRDIASATDQRYIDWSEISCEEFGDSRTECLFLYDFPTPFEVPLAKYGAVYINKQKQIYSYYTLEKSAKGYMLCSTSKNNHLNYGEKGDMSKIGFIKEICNIQKIDEVSLLEWRLAKSKSSVTEYVDLSGKVHKEFSEDDLNVLIDLKDDDYQEFITNHTNAIICFYELYKGPSKLMLNLLSEFATDYKEKIAVGIYDVYGDGNEIIRAKLNIMAMPTFLIYKNGEETHKHIGLCNRDSMKKMFEDLLS